MNPPDIVSQLRQARRAAGLTQAQVADQAGYSRWILQRWETGAHSPSVDAVAAYAGALGLELHIGSPEHTAALVSKSLLNLDAYIEARATELAKAHISGLHRKGAAA
ncbi:helix-turn-helix transcriptional regulator [Nocardiopsis eucommiae]|uniref:helix-turn-helix transcriptional regulator n=1 Tax=Nocardiopsis eucommiae TaxID=2831970 RepID=UPI003D74405C